MQDVGSQTAQKFTLSNIGVDTYPINNISITGENAEDFVSEIPEGITLEPGDVVEIDVAFSPLGAGQRTASLDIDYDTIVGVGSCLLYTSPSPRDKRQSRMPSSA